MLIPAIRKIVSVRNSYFGGKPLGIGPAQFSDLALEEPLLEGHQHTHSSEVFFGVLLR